jgi:hypothetical protein
MLLTLVKIYAIFTEQSGDVVALNEASSSLHQARLVQLSKFFKILCEGRHNLLKQ